MIVYLFLKYMTFKINLYQEEFNSDLKIIEKNYKFCQVIIKQIQKLPNIL